MSVHVTNWYMTFPIVMGGMLLNYFSKVNNYDVTNKHDRDGKYDHKQLCAYAYL
jgi:hypothetical protein